MSLRTASPVSSDDFWTGLVVGLGLSGLLLVVFFIMAFSFAVAKGAAL